VRSPLLLPALLVLLPACASTSGPKPSSAKPRAEVIAESARIFGLTGSHEAEAYLAAAGADAVSSLRPLLETEDPDVRLRVVALLRQAGEPVALTTDEEVDLLLRDLLRPEPYAYSSLRALARLEEMGESALPALRAAARGEGDGAIVARRLLSSLGEEP